jgi:hypothetical protein
MTARHRMIVVVLAALAIGGANPICDPGDLEQRGCCSRHGGVCGCGDDGRTVCCDGTKSPSCRC